MVVLAFTCVALAVQAQTLISPQLPGLAPVEPVSRSQNKLDIFSADTAGVIRTAAWEPAFTDGWHGWWSLNGGQAAPGAPVTVVSRSQDKLDVFVVGLDHRVWTAAWEPGFTDGWHGWWPIGEISAYNCAVCNDGSCQCGYNTRAGLCANHNGVNPTLGCVQQAFHVSDPRTIPFKAANGPGKALRHAGNLCQGSKSQLDRFADTALSGDGRLGSHGTM